MNTSGDAGRPAVNGAVRDWLAIGGAAAIAVGCFLPWITATAPLLGTVTRSGVEGGGDGLFFLAGAAIIGWWGLASLQSHEAPPGRPRTLILLLVLGMAVGVLYEISAVGDRIKDVEMTLGSASTGPGLYLMLVGCVVALAGVKVPGRNMEGSGG